MVSTLMECVISHMTNKTPEKETNTDILNKTWTIETVTNILNLIHYNLCI